MKHVIAALFVLPSLGLADGAAPLGPDCACINRDGRETPLGQVACLTVDGQSFLARCGRSQNVLTWRKVQDGCPMSDFSLFPISKVPSEPA